MEWLKMQWDWLELKCEGGCDWNKIGIGVYYLNMVKLNFDYCKLFTFLWFPSSLLALYCFIFRVREYHIHVGKNILRKYRLVCFMLFAIMVLLYTLTAGNFVCHVNQFFLTYVPSSSLTLHSCYSLIKLVVIYNHTHILLLCKFMTYIFRVLIYPS